MKHKWWTYLIPGLGMGNILDDLFGLYGNGDGSVLDKLDPLGFWGNGSKSDKDSSPFLHALNGLFKGISGFDWEKGVTDLMNYYTGGTTSAQLEAQNFSSAEAEKQRAWEQEMSNTAFQRQTQDMIAAGVNPALMYGGAGSSGASTPSGASASSSGLAGSGNIFDALFQMMAIGPEVKLKKAQAAKTEAEASKAQTEADIAEETKQTTIKITEQTLTNLEKTQKEIENRAGKEAAQAAVFTAEEKGITLQNFFLQFRKNLTEHFGLDPNQPNYISGAIAVAMSITQHIEQLVPEYVEGAERASKVEKEMVTNVVKWFTSAFGKGAGRKLVAELNKSGGLTIEDSTFESWDYPESLTD